MLVLVVLLLIFIIQNSQEVEIKFIFFGSFNTALIFALVIAALLGALIGWLAPRVRRRCTSLTCKGSRASTRARCATSTRFPTIRTTC